MLQAPHSTPVPEEMDFDLFGPSSGSPSAQPPITAAQVPGSGSAPTGAPVQLPVPPTPTLGADQLQQLLQMLNNQNTALQQQQNQMNFLMQAQSAQLTLLNRRLDEEEARRKAEEARQQTLLLPQVQEVVQEQLYRRLPGRLWHLRVYLLVL